ncbi:hypothetical protein DFH06DRAFT_1149244 [Mycena polygramma]|nr:hypothetical protein DFH06DRAFT_1149244 [Mycena polygramma]
MGFRSSFLEQYSRIWAPATLLAAGMALCSFAAELRVVATNNGSLLFLVTRGMLGHWGVFREKRVLFLTCFLLVLIMGPVLQTLEVLNIACMIAVYILLESRQPLMLIIYTIFNTTLCFSEIYLRDDFRKHMKDMIVLRTLDYLVLSDATSLNTKVTRKGTNPKEKLWSRLVSLFSRPSKGPISLPIDDEAGDGLEMDVGDDDPAPPTSSPWKIPAELTENVLHWSRLSTEWDTHKALWISTDNKGHHSAIAHAVSRVLISEKSMRSRVAVVDLSQTRSAFWPLTRGFAAALPEYRAALGDNPPSAIRDNSVHVPKFRAGRPDLSPWLYYSDRTDVITNLITRPLRDVYKELDKARGSDSESDLESARAPEPPRIILVVHGIRNNDQGDEVSDTINELEVKLKKRYKYVGVVAISSSKILRHVSDDDPVIMDYVCTLFVSKSGSILYSGKSPNLPAFYKNLFLLLVDGIHRTGGVRAERLWNQLTKLASLSDADPPEGDAEDGSTSTLSIFSALYKASQARTQILELLSKIKVVSRSRINKRLLQDNAKIAGLLQQLVKHNSYKKDIQQLPREHAIAILNLTHYTLDRGLPDKAVVKDYKQFSLRAHRLLNWLAAYLQLLPDELAVHGVKLLSDHPIKHGGFSNIYHAKYKDPDGEEVEVALKVLKIFEDQSDERRLLLHNKFTKEALVWHYLRHKNIVRFIGVDSTTFPSPARAMVSPWMPLGSVLKYMTEFSPSSMYAIDLRNILMDKHGRAMLTDFGLAAFIESDVTMKTSTRSGSTRWMAPELVLPPPGAAFKRTPESDIWAFGCVCCEIWSEGEVPFSGIGSEMGVIFAFSDSAETALPYPTRPCDKGGNPMPDVLWDLVQWCFKHSPADRPSVQVLADVLSDVKKETKSQADTMDVDTDMPPIASGSGTSRQRDGRRSPSPSVADVWESTSPSPSPVPLPGKGKGRVRFEDKYPTVRFGPVDVDGDPEKIFSLVFEGLLDLVSKNVLVEPLLVEELDAHHLALRFQSPVEANNFAMTWMFHRFEPYLGVSATLVDN